MIIDHLSNASRYYAVHNRFKSAFEFLQNTDLAALEPGKHMIEGEAIFAIASEYDTKAATNEKMEAHKKYIDIQYWVKGEELVGHELLNDLKPSKAYDEEKDFMLFDEAPSFFSKMQPGMFAVYFPTDLHMPCINVDQPTGIKKIVIKVQL